MGSRYAHAGIINVVDGIGRMERDFHERNFHTKVRRGEP